MKTKMYKLRAALIITLANLLIISSVFAQAPQKMSYQAVIRNAGNVLVSNTVVGMKISIMKNAPNTGVLVYSETQTPTTNANGLVSIEIGNGAGFDTIHWENGLYFIKTETDPAGGANYTITGSSQLLSIPYALHAQTAESVSGGITETDPVFVASPANGITGTNINNWNTAYGWGNHNLAGYLTTEFDGLIGNEVTNATNTTLTRSGSGTNTTPYTLGLNLANANTWTAQQTFNDKTNFPGPGIWTISGNVGIGTTSPMHKLEVIGDMYVSELSSFNNGVKVYGQVQINTPLGTPPLLVASTTKVDNLNVDLLDGYHVGNATGNVPVSNGTLDTNLNADLLDGKHAANFLTSFTETDPIFVASPANGITNTNITNWNTAFGWGNHVGLYRPIGWVPAWADVTGKPTGSNPGDMLYWNGSAWLNVPAGQPGQFLQYTASNVPTWTSLTPSLTTSAVSSITSTTATCGGNVTNEGGMPVIARGVCWSTSPNPTTADSKTTDGAGSGTFTSSIIGLTLGNTYYVRAYATNSLGTTYGNQVTFLALDLGDSYQGGIVAYILQPGDPGYIAGETHGLITTATDQGQIQWGITITTGATATALGTGNANTNTIIAVLGAGSYAAQLCADLVIGPYEDWYLPSYDELYKIYLNKGASGITINLAHWSSSEISNNIAWSINMDNGLLISWIWKSQAYFVRAVRSF